MSKVFKKSTSILLVLTLLLSLFAISCYAVQDEEDYGVMPCWSTIDSIHTSFTISGLNSNSYVYLVSQVSTSLKIVVNLQKLKSGSYETIETWTETGKGTSLELDESRLINVFSDYRIKITCTAGSETNVSYDYP